MQKRTFTFCDEQLAFVCKRFESCNERKRHIENIGWRRVQCMRDCFKRKDGNTFACFHGKYAAGSDSTTRPRNIKLVRCRLLLLDWKKVILIKRYLTFDFTFGVSKPCAFFWQNRSMKFSYPRQNLYEHKL